MLGASHHAADLLLTCDPCGFQLDAFLGAAVIFAMVVGLWTVADFVDREWPTGPWNS